MSCLVLPVSRSYAKIARDDRARRDIDAKLDGAVAARSLPQLELLLRSATAAGVTSRAIEGARLLVAQLRAMGDRDRIQVRPLPNPLLPPSPI